MTSFSPKYHDALPNLSRNATVVLAVLVLHGALLWALQSGLLRQVAEVVAPAEIMVEILAPAAHTSEAQPAQSAATPSKPTVSKQATPVKPAPASVVTPQPAATPLAVAPSATAPEATVAEPTAATSTSASSHSSTALSPAIPVPPKVELPSTDADYLNNAKPAYPILSKRLHEQGQVTVRVFIDADGQASQASIKQSSGFERLDLASVETVLKWRYLPGKRAGVPQGMWFDVPINWQLTR